MSKFQRNVRPKLNIEVGDDFPHMFEAIGRDDAYFRQALRDEAARHEGYSCKDGTTGDMVSHGEGVIGLDELSERLIVDDINIDAFDEDELALLLPALAESSSDRAGERIMQTVDLEEETNAQTHSGTFFLENFPQIDQAVVSSDEWEQVSDSDWEEVTGAESVISLMSREYLSYRDALVLGGETTSEISVLPPARTRSPTQFKLVPLQVVPCRIELYSRLLDPNEFEVNESDILTDPYFEYEGYKLGRGGKDLLMFKGNQRILKSSSR